MRKWLWLLVILAATGDVVTTAHGLNQQEIEEKNPAVNNLVAEMPVIPVMIAVKLVATGIALVAQRMLSAHKWVPPAALLIVWGPVALWNIVVLGVS